jgi:hypothetical protein
MVDITKSVIVNIFSMKYELMFDIFIMNINEELIHLLIDSDYELSNEIDVSDIDQKKS